MQDKNEQRSGLECCAKVKYRLFKCLGFCNTNDTFENVNRIIKHCHLFDIPNAYTFLYILLQIANRMVYESATAATAAVLIMWYRHYCLARSEPTQEGRN